MSAVQQNLVCSKIVRDWAGGTRPLSATDLNLGNFRPGPGMTARIVMPHSVRAWDPEVPVVIARAVLAADGWMLDFTARPDLMARLAREIAEAVEALKASR